MKCFPHRSVPGLLLAFATCLAAAPAAARQAAPSWPARHVGHDYFAGSNATMGRSVAGDLTGDAQSDVVVLAGGVPAILYGPGWHDSVVALTAGVQDVEILRKGGLMGRDALVVARASGCELWRVDRTVAGNFATTALPWSSANGALRIRAGDVDADGALDVVALESNSRTLRTIRGAAGATPTESSITIAQTIHDFVLLDWDALPGLECAVLTSNGLRVLRSNGTTAYANATGGAGDALARVRGVIGQDRVALVAKNAGIDMLHVFGQGVVEPALPLGALATVGLASSDLDGDGDLDLVVSRQSTHELLVLWNGSPGTPSFSTAPGSTLALDPGPGSTPAPANQAVPALADFDQDGDVDVAFPVQSTKRVCVLANPLATPAPRKIGWESPEYDYCISAVQGTLSLSLLQPAAPLAGATHVEITGWEQHAVGGLADDAAVKHRYVPLAWVGGEQVLDMHVFEHFDNDDDIQIYEIREVALAPATLEKLAVGPPLILEFTTEDANQAALGALQILVHFLCGLHPSGGDTDAGIVEFEEVPDFESLDLALPMDESIVDFGE